MGLDVRTLVAFGSGKGRGLRIKRHEVSRVMEMFYYLMEY